MSNADSFLIGDLIEFVMPKAGMPYPLAKIFVADGEVWIRWGEPAEIIKQFGLPQPGNKVLVELGRTGRPDDGLARRFYGDNEIPPDWDKDERKGLTKSIASQFEPDPSIEGQSPYGYKRSMGVPGSNVGVEIDNTQAVLKGGSHNRIVSDKEAGNIITGPLSIGCGFSEFKLAGFWSLNPLMQGMIPSTIVTPLPTFLFELPTAGIQGIGQVVRDLTNLLA